MPTDDKERARRSEEQRARRPNLRLHSRRRTWVGYVALLVAVSLVTADQLVEYAISQAPLPREVTLPMSSRVYDRHGNLIATYRDEITRFIVDTRKLPRYVREAVVASEDRSFFKHEGVSLPGMVRAAWANATSGRVKQGGSTITQQYVKNAVLEDFDRTIERKVKEVLLSVKLERRYGKANILDRYLNTVYFGRGAYGIEAAARIYFGKRARALSLAEAAYLAGIIPAPEQYQPPSSRTAVHRRRYVLNSMKEEGYISPHRAQRAARTKLKLATSKEVRRRRQPAAYFVEWLRREYLYPRFGECLYRCGLKIYTAIDMRMQRHAEEVIARILNVRGDPPAALVAMTPDGKVRAFVGGKKFHSIPSARGLNYAVDVRRQAGSAFKPFTLLSAIEQGISPSSRFSGHSPKTIEDLACSGPEGRWIPENYGGTSYGTVDLVDATSDSINTVYAELISEVGPEDVAELVERFGFRPAKGRRIDPVCSLALGTLDVSVLEMTRAYAAIAGRGVLPKVVPLVRIENRHGRCVVAYGRVEGRKCTKVIEAEGRRVADTTSVDVLTSVLTHVVGSGTATSAQIGRPAAGKTGTTQDNRDAWFAGYTPQLATVVWMGYAVEKGRDGKFGTGDDVSPVMQTCGSLARCRPVHGISVTGGSFPATIWGSFMLTALEGSDVLPFPVPSDLPDTVVNPLPPPPPEPVEDEVEVDEEEEDVDEPPGQEGDEEGRRGRGKGYKGDEKKDDD